MVFEEAESVDRQTPDDGNAPPFPGSPDGRVPDISETFDSVAMHSSDMSGPTGYDPLVDDPEGYALCLQF